MLADPAPVAVALPELLAFPGEPPLPVAESSTDPPLPPALSASDDAFWLD
jgi:hypothetical protein